ncbi:transglycosylase [Staphylococcus argensis]|uniref:Transglycosylase n=1 Tax=Staphylococcus argensis TaxID=1607738 RepID=A0A2K4FAZ5_9STAP|nr:transglycosylase family protein [Staphylococcus argensis]POA08125.1 transglycosylase [Staphylococcus argensis]
MKKTLIASTVAVGLGVTGVAGGHHSADAAEQGVNKAELADLAQHNPQQLNESPVQEGSYNYDFNYNGAHYHFESNGSTWSWSWNGYGEAAQQDNTQEEAATTSNVNTQQVSTQQQPKQQQAPQTAQTQQPKQQQAPQTAQTQQPKQESTTQAQPKQQSTSSKGSSAGTPAGMEGIVQRESGGDPTAVNPSSGAAGKYQFLQSTWDSVAPSQYQGVSPAKVPEHVQDQVANKLWNGGSGASHWAPTV